MESWLGMGQLTKMFWSLILVVCQSPKPVQFHYICKPEHSRSQKIFRETLESQKKNICDDPGFTTSLMCITIP